MDVLPDRSSASAAKWLREQPEVEVVSLDPHRLTTEGALDGAPQAVQITDRFYLAQSFGERIDQRLGRFRARSGGASPRSPRRIAHRLACTVSRQLRVPR